MTEPGLPGDLRGLLLAVPSAAVLVALVLHSYLALAPRRRAAFWSAATAYGVLRGIGVALVTREGLGAQMPYAVHAPLLSVFGVSLQEVIGWTIVLYLAWWIGSRFSASLSIQTDGRVPQTGEPPRTRGERGRSPGASGSSREARRVEARPSGALGDGGAEPLRARLFPALFWGCLFLGAIGWAVETAAVAAGWWHWTVPATHAALLGVPAIGPIDWFFAGTDFLLPFAVLTAPSLARSPLRWLSLLAFPMHFGSHLLTQPLASWLPVPVFHLVHWGFLGLLLGLAFHRTESDTPFREAGAISRWLPAAALIVVLADTAGVEAFVVHRPFLTLSVLPALVVLVLAALPRAGIWIAGGSAGLALAAPPLALSAIPGAASWALSSRHARSFLSRPAILTVMIAAAMLAVHVPAARREAALKAGLAEAIAARDAGDLPRAERILDGFCRDAPSSHAPCALLGEILYRTGRAGAARDAYRRAVAVKEDFLDGHRHLAVIGLQTGDTAGALASAEAGLRTSPRDLELRYLRGRTLGAPADPALGEEAARAGPAASAALAGLAYEVGDREETLRVLELGLARTPGDPRLQALMVRLRGRAAPPGAGLLPSGGSTREPRARGQGTGQEISADEAR